MPVYPYNEARPRLGLIAVLAGRHVRLEDEYLGTLPAEVAR